MIRWEPPGPYEVAFSTREGGVSDGPYASLNLGRMTGDDVERVDENRRLLCAAVGADPERLALNRQVHSTLVHRAEPGARGEPGDGLWTDEPEPADPRDDGGLPADRARAHGRRRRRSPSCTPAGAACSPGSSRAGPSARRAAPGRASARRSGRAATRWARRWRSPSRRRSGRTSCAAGKLDLWSAAERALHAAGVDDVSAYRRLHVLQPGALLLAPPDRQAARRPGSDRPCRLRRCARTYERIRAEVGPDVTVVAATKYVSLEDMAVLAEAGVEVVGENRAQDLERKHAVYGDAFRWHFIGHLQSNKAKVVNGICELVHSLASESAAQRLDGPRARRGEPLRRGVEIGRSAGGAPRPAARLSATFAA